MVSGRAEMAPTPGPEALRQVRLRYRQAAAVADRYFEAGLSVVLQDTVLGAELPEVVRLVTSRPLLLVVLCPRPEIVAAREAQRPKRGYGRWSVQQLDAVLRRETPRIGLWIDSSEQTPEETVDEILARAWDDARVPE